MKNKIVIWSTNEKEEKFLLAIELQEKDNVVNIYKFPQAVVTEEFHNQLLNEWKKDQEVTFVTGYETISNPLSVTDDLLPEDLKVERPDIITRAKAEWHFAVLSSKLYELYSSELNDIQEKVNKVSEYSSSLWEEMKGFWDKVQSQVQEKNLFREHANELRSTTNEVFEKLKSMRKQMDLKFKAESKEQVDYFHNTIQELKEKINLGKSLQPIFDELKSLQSKFTKAKFTREDRNKIWAKIDETFKELKEKKYGSTAGKSSGNNNALSRLENRLVGLQSALDRMKNSIDRDLRDKNNQANQAENAGGQLEAQLRQARIAMIDERISSKQIKMKDMLATKADLEKKIEKEKAREEQRKTEAEIKAKAEEKKQEIKEQIEAKTQEIDPEDAAKLAAAAAEIKSAKSKSKSSKQNQEGKDSTDKKEESSLSDKVEDVIEDISDVVEDVVDSVKAMASVAIDKIEDMIEKVTKDEEE